MTRQDEIYFYFLTVFQCEVTWDEIFLFSFCGHAFSLSFCVGKKWGFKICLHLEQKRIGRLCLDRQTILTGYGNYCNAKCIILEGLKYSIVTGSDEGGKSLSLGITCDLQRAYISWHFCLTVLDDNVADVSVD